MVMQIKEVMEEKSQSDRSALPARVLVLSMFFAPCREVGGKRFSYLSHHLSSKFSAYHVLARRERDTHPDSTAFTTNVHRTTMIPHWPPTTSNLLTRALARVWSHYICTIDKYIGWVLPATIRGVRLCRKEKLNVVIVTGPQFSAMLAGIAICRLAGAKLIIDYRDEWTNFREHYPKPFGKYFCSKLERSGIRMADAIVLNTEIMRTDFIAAFAAIAPPIIEVIYSGFEPASDISTTNNSGNLVNMIYAGNFHGKRRLSVIATALAQLLADGTISETSFRFNIYARLRPVDYELIEKFGLTRIIRVHERVSYDEILKTMRSSDILFLPSSDEVLYAVPFKFFDYLSVRRPILAVASPQSSVGQLMRTIDCGEFADFGDQAAIVGALKALICREKLYSFDGAERLSWRAAAERYADVILRVTGGINASESINSNRYEISGNPAPPQGPM